MTDAPERIYAQAWHHGNTAKTFFHTGTNCKTQVFGQTEYVRADIVAEMTKALEWMHENVAFAHRKNIKGVAKEALAKARGEQQKDMK